MPVAAAEQRDIPLDTTLTGRVEAIDRVELRARVGGALDAVLFLEGATVRAGAPLFQIDRRPYEIALRRADAAVAIVEAQLERAREEFARAERLALSDAVSVEEVGRRRSALARLTAELESTRAAAADAALQLEWTTVRAPVSGRIGRAEVTAGNVIGGGVGPAAPLALLQSLDPVFVYFDLDPVTADRARAAPRDAWRATVSTFEGGPPFEGPIDFVDHGVGAHTGTLKMRARIANPDGRLLPSAVVRVVFRYGVDSGRTVVPERAIGSDQGARYVLVTRDDGTVEYRPVSLGANAGAWRAVLSDTVQPGDLVVLPGFPGLRPGMTVLPEPAVVR
ncbi:MAG: efflux RND transporter periplasmic adaptor subunit [Vicinamibacterales bacterium]|nr:efflux RND transporter periplasmic adaptor subunit [Vicinamibacterales bacterium]